MHISDSSIFNRYIIIVYNYSNINNLHITCTSCRLLILFANHNNNCIVSQETNYFVLNSCDSFLSLTWAATFILN